MNDQLGITGQWVNKYTNDVINVRDSVIDGDEMIIISDVGHINMKDFSENYIQISDTYTEAAKTISGNGVVDMASLKTLDPTIVTHQIHSSNVVEDTPKPSIIQHTEQIQSPSLNNEKFNLIDKLFNKIHFNPIINIHIESTNYPKEQLKMLKDIYDITNEDIANYIRDNYIFPETINDSIIKFVEKY